MITPTLLILASGSPIATALLRLARVVDRARKLSELGTPPPEGELRRHERRAFLAERAVRLYFAAVVCFVVVSFAVAADHFAGNRLTWLPVVITSVGMCLLVAGSAAMVMECRLAAMQIRAEIMMLSRAASKATTAWGRITNGALSAAALQIT